MSGKHPEWLFTTVSAVRELMLKRLARPTLDNEAKRDAEMAVKTLDLLWEQLEGETTLLSREHERYLAFFENAPDAYLVTDVGGSVREANRAALELLRLPLELVKGKALIHMLPEADKTVFLTRLVALMAAPAAASWSAHILGGNASPLPVQLAVRPIPLARSGVAGLCWSIRPG
jgi:PAS domain S-box-containing protein